MNVLIDTSVVIDHLRRSDKTTSFLTRIITNNIGIKLSIVTLGELYSGLYASKQEEEIKNILGYTEILSLSLDIAKQAGVIRRDTGVALIDSFIAATAGTLQIPVATLNTKDFSRIEGITLYTLEEKENE